MTPLGSESTVGGNGVNLPPWQADSEFPTAPPPETTFTQRLSDDDDTAPLPVLPRPSSSAAASAFRAASTHVSESARAASLSFTPGGQWWNELAQLQSVRHRRPPRASLALCAVIFAVTAAVVSWVLLRPLHAQRSGRRLSCADHHATCHFAGCRRAETAHRSATDQTPDSDRVTLGQGILRALTIGCVKGGEAIT
jgi:hypothetical protein